MKIISIDAATKSLAIACLEFHNLREQLGHVVSIINDADANANVAIRASDALNPITVHSLSVVDLIPGKKVSECTVVQRTAALLQYMSKFMNNIKEDGWFDWKTNVLIEYQMGPNQKSGDIQMQLLYHFLQIFPQKNIHVVRPASKNKLYFAKNPASFHAEHVKKYTTKYAANKSHTKYLFLEWLTAYNLMDKIRGINKKNYADIADAFCQAAAWHAQL